MRYRYSKKNYEPPFMPYRQEHWVARRETSGVELVKFGERFSGDVDADTELSLAMG